MDRLYIGFPAAQSKGFLQFEAYLTPLIKSINSL